MGKIIAFCGRMRSGKTELAKICEQHGYEKLYFALPLKQLCAEILNVSIEELNKAKADNTDINLYIGNDLCETISQKTEISIEEVKNTCYGKTINTVREMLQFIGTDLIRNYNKDWHVNKIRAMIDENKNYVIDDVRFPNELKMIEELGGDSWFVIRPTFCDISNHESETSLTWKDCWNKVIINDTTLFNLQFKWETFVCNYDKSCAIRDKEFNRILENGTQNEITPLSIYDMMFLTKDMFNYIPKVFKKENIKKIILNEDKTVFITYNDGTIEMIDNLLTIEEIKSLI